MVDSINAINAFEEKTGASIASTYDFNGDGTVDILDYQLACKWLNDDDPANDTGYTKAQLDTVFASVLSSGDKYYKEVTEENVNEVAQEIINAMNNGLSPSNATNLNHLQEIGRQLTAYIKEASEAANILSTQIKKFKAELEEIKEEKEIKEKEYEDKKAQVEEKTEELSRRMVSAIEESQQLATQQQQACNNIVKRCVEEYKNGKYEGKNLYDVITLQLAGASDGGFDTTRLQYHLKQNDSLGQEIKSICGDIDTLVSDIQAVTIRYNNKNTQLETAVNNRNGVLEAATKASIEYQKGYSVRQEMRQAIVDKYYVEGNGGVTSGNDQVKMLGDFINNGELDNMTFSDAWAILTTTFNNCGIKYDSTNNKITVPYGHDSSSHNIYAALVTALNKNFGTGVAQQEEEYIDPTTITTTTGTTPVIVRSDPMSFTDGNVKYDFIIDRDNDGIMDDASEFLGAQNGWSEMLSYDTNGDGVISGDELQKLKLVAHNQDSGQYTFMNAAEAGITSIDLNSYQKKEEMQHSGDIVAGTFNIVKDGKTIEGIQTEDTSKNLTNKYSIMFGSEMKDLSEDYEGNPFMEKFEETINTDATVNSTQADINANKNTSDSIIDKSEQQINAKITDGVYEAKAQKKRADKKAQMKKDAQAEEKAEEEKSSKSKKA